MRAGLLLLPSAFFLLAGCDDDSLYQRPDPPDGGVVEHFDATPPRDAEARDAPAAPDAAPAPDAEPMPPPAAQPVYIHTGTTLYSYDPTSNVTTTIGDFHDGSEALTGMVDIAIDLRGAMYGGSLDKVIYRVDPTTAACTRLSVYDDALNGLTFVSDGRFIVAGDRVTIVDPRSGAMVRELVPAGRYITSGDIIGLPDGYLYWTVRGESGGDGLVRIDPNTGETTLMGSGSVDRIFGLGFAFDVLYGFSTRGVAVVIDRQSGQVMTERPLTGRWYGATTNPVLWE